MNEIFYPPPPLPENFRVEGVGGTLPEGIQRSECHRYIGSGNFWGDSAVDVCCGDETVVRSVGTDQVTYAPCYLRYPTTPSSGGSWTPIELPIHSDAELVASSFLFEEFLSEPLLATAFADEPGEIEWSENEWVVGKELLAGVAAQMHQAFLADNIGEVGAPDTEFRRYSEFAYAVALWGAGYMEGFEEDAVPLLLTGRFCPDEMPQCCFDTGDLELVWADLAGFVPESGNFNVVMNTLFFVGLLEVPAGIAGGGLGGAAAMEVLTTLGRRAVGRAVELLFHHEINIEPKIRIPATLKIDRYPNVRGVAVSLLASGMTQYMLAESRQYFTFLQSGGSSEAPLQYTDATTAFIVASIVYHFLDESVRVAADQAVDTSSLRNLYELLQSDPRLARLAVIYNNDLEEGVRESTTTTQRFAASMANVPIVDYVENRFQRTGGLSSFLGQLTEKCKEDGSGCSEANQPDNEHNEVDSPTCESECENSEDPACHPPDCAADPDACEENPEDTGAGSEDPNGVPDCVAYYDEYILEGRSVGQSCYRSCWDNLPSFGNLCVTIKTYDL
ncbi:MAG: hypothetical protein HYY44_05900, partial [Deltaproteobacteria bacterium]|nr:hypothetical protein [Deltaproteobacteria bacterium]